MQKATAAATQLVAVLVCTALLFTITTAASPNNMALAQQQSSLPPTEMASEFLTYENAEAGISIDYPSDWILFERELDDEPTFVAAFIAPQAELADLAIHIETLPEDMTLQEYTEIGNQTIRAVFPDADITMSSSDDMTLSGNPAHVVTYSATLPDDGNGTSGRITQVWTVTGGKAYIVTYRASSDEYQAFTQVVDRMIGSLQITQPSSLPPSSSPSVGGEPAPATVTNNTTSTAGNASGFEASRQELLSDWQQTPFSDSFSTYIESGSDQGYGVYTEHSSSNIFSPDDTVELYLEPIGFSHKPVLGDEGEQLYLINLTASVQITQNMTTSPEAVQAINQTISDIQPIVIVSHRQNTELYMTIPVYLYQSEVPEGEYTITYRVEDGVSGQSFTIEKDIRIAETVSSTI